VTGLDLSRCRPAVRLYVHMSREWFDAGRTATQGAAVPGVARVEGIGPLTVRQAVDLLRHTNVRLAGVVDLGADTPVDGYELPRWMREQLPLRSPASCFPWSPNLSRRKDSDHTVPYVAPAAGGPPGQTRIGNLGPLERPAHRVKTHAAGWRHRQPAPGVFLWRTPHGWPTSCRRSTTTCWAPGRSNTDLSSGES
jgi:hypothetical protein